MPAGDPCRHCGSPSTYYAAGVGPHAAQLRCGDCGKLIRWLSRDEAGRIGDAAILASEAAHKSRERAKRPTLFD